MLKEHKGRITTQKQLNSDVLLREKDMHNFQQFSVQRRMQNDTKNRNIPDSDVLHIYTHCNLLLNMIS